MISKRNINICIFLIIASKNQNVQYMVSSKFRQSACMQIEQIKLNRKILYHFPIFAIVNEILIFKNCRISG